MRDGQVSVDVALGETLDQSEFDNGRELWRHRVLGHQKVRTDGRPIGILHSSQFLNWPFSLTNMSLLSRGSRHIPSQFETAVKNVIDTRL